MWIAVFGLSLGVCISNGFARFAYGLILPAMKDELGWTYAQAGWINTANALGYVIGAILTFLVVSRFGPSRLFRVGVVLTSVFLLFGGLTDGFWWLTLWRILAGVFGAAVFISGGAITASFFTDDPKRNALSIALYFGGGGLGMIFSGTVLPALFENYGSSAWNTAWILLGVVSLLCCPICLWAASQTETAGPSLKSHTRLPVSEMRAQLVGYGLFATGYIVYLTFLGALMRNLDVNYLIVSGTWIVVGIGIMASPFIWKSLLARSDSGIPLAAATTVVAIGTIAPIIAPSTAGLFLSAALFGVAVFVAPSAVTSFSRKNLPKDLWGRSVGLFTIVFAVGQTLGPVASGAIGDAFGSINYGLAAAALVLMAGAIVACFQRPITQTSRARS